MTRKLKILIAASEGHPYSKTGGLADVVGTLPLALQAKNHDVRVILPKHQCALNHKLEIHPLDREFSVPIGSTQREGTLYEGNLSGRVPVYLVENDFYFKRAGIYGAKGTDFPDNAERFIFFCRAILESCKALSFFPDIIHLNDWHTGLVPVYLKTLYNQDKRLSAARTVFTIHNLAYQGNFEAKTLDLTGLPKQLFAPEGLEFYGQLSFLKAGLVYADRLNTVSPTYSREIRTKDLGCGMDGLLKNRENDLHGILNGIDYDEWNPETDSQIVTQYSPRKLMGKLDCKRYLAENFSLDIENTTPILGMVTRLANQKGIDLVMESLESIMKLDVAFVLLGTGDPDHEIFFKKAARNFRGRCGIRIEFDPGLSHQIVAGSDVLMVPSSYEPCGLTQMFALKYGTVPLVRAVGGLHDTVNEFRPGTGKGTGFKFRKYQKKDLLQSVRKALSCYRNPTAWKQLMQNAMAENFGWEQAAGKYLRMYRKTLRS
ncbi:hypothetical protein UZ36_02490 [Candidatus Nitromaritima sp. SCGC AAA799-C22]|nr:hypothetical protein UZ36_02490 [Candidatus Nitromaritima sp. SCGC AAA799-C22]